MASEPAVKVPEELLKELAAIRKHAENLLIDGRLSKHMDKHLSLQREAKMLLERCEKLETKLKEL